MRISRQMLGIAAAGMLGLTATLSAQDVEFHGAVFGCFDTGSGCTSTNPALDGNLKYNGDTFDNTTLLNGAVPAGFSDGPLSGSFGHLNLLGDYTPAIGTTLRLEFFFNPATLGLVPPFAGTPDATSTTIYAASISGTVTGNAGGVFIDFGSPVQFAFTNGGTSAGGFTHSGIATITINDVALIPHATNQAITGSIASRVTDTPEPATVALFATGLVGLIPVARRRAKNRA